jgi:hypothetical protein
MLLIINIMINSVRIRQSALVCECTPDALRFVPQRPATIIVLSVAPTSTLVLNLRWSK